MGSSTIVPGIGVPTHEPTLEPTESTHFVACGRNGRCESKRNSRRSIQPYATADSELYAVRCVSETYNGKRWMRRVHCFPEKLWWASDAWKEGCQRALSWTDANAFCQRYNGRLPTLDEITEKKCRLKGSGCKFNTKLVWTSTPGIFHPESTIPPPPGSTIPPPGTNWSLTNTVFLIFIFFAFWFSWILFSVVCFAHLRTLYICFHYFLYIQPLTLEVSKV